MDTNDVDHERRAQKRDLPLRIDRTTRGQVSGPVPWVLAGEGRVWAWDQTVGLVRLTSAEEPVRPVFQWDALTPDGRYLYYLSVTHWDNGRIVYELETGQWHSRPTKAFDGSFVGSFPPLSTAQRLDGYRYNLAGRPPDYQNGRYIVRRGDQAIEVPIDDLPGLPLEGPQVQFSPVGDEVAIGLLMTGPDTYGTAVFGINSGDVTRFDGLGVSTCGTWSPSATRLLLRRVREYIPSVVVRATGEVSPLNETIFADQSWRHSAPQVSGWLDDTRVMINGQFGRRIIISTLDVDTGERVDLLDIPKPPGTAYQGIRYAPALAQAAPSIIGPITKGS